MKTTTKRVQRHYTTELNASAAEVFPLLCPIMEYKWIPQWQCDMVYAASGIAELGCVFMTDFGDGCGREIWVTSHYVPGEKIAFVRTGSHRTTRYEITLQERHEKTVITWFQELTSLDEKGDELVSNYTDEAFLSIMVPLNKMLAHYLETGRPLEIDLGPPYLKAYSQEAR